MPTWTARSETLTDRAGTRVRIERDARPASVTEVLAGWRDDAEFREQFSGWLAESPYSAFRWETPAALRSTLSRPFEFVLLDAPRLARNPDPAPFAEHFREEAEVVTFSNLGGDAVLVVPTPRGPAEGYGHLAAFLRAAPPPQRHALWIAVAAAMAERIGERPVWLSTAGAGVSWLHVRLDDVPKYYGFAAYRSLV